MPKMKTHKGASGRFEVTKKGKLKRRRQGTTTSWRRRVPSASVA
jgi:ribosomal protein L35